MFLENEAVWCKASKLSFSTHPRESVDETDGSAPLKALSWVCTNLGGTAEIMSVP